MAKPDSRPHLDPKATPKIFFSLTRRNLARFSRLTSFFEMVCTGLLNGPSDSSSEPHRWLGAPNKFTVVDNFCSFKSFTRIFTSNTPGLHMSSADLVTLFNAYGYWMAAMNSLGAEEQTLCRTFHSVICFSRTKTLMPGIARQKSLIGHMHTWLSIVYCLTGRIVSKLPNLSLVSCPYH